MFPTMADTVQEKKLPVSPKVKSAMALIKRGIDTMLIEEELEQKLPDPSLRENPCALN